MLYRMWMRASLARRESIRSRTDIKISSFHEDSRNKDCKKVWNEPRALLRAHISQPFPFSFSPPTTPAHSFFFLILYFSLCISLSFRRCKGAGVAAVYEYSRSLRQWNDERHPHPTSPPLDAQPRTFYPASYRKEELHARFPPAVPPCEPYHRFLKLPRASGPPSVSFIKIKPPLLATDVIARRRCTRSMDSLRPI